MGDAVGGVGAGGAGLRARIPRGDAPVRVPFLHFFDGFRTSHQIDKIAMLSDDDIAALIRDDDIATLSGRAGTDARRAGRAGTAQNPDVFFQAREAANPFHLAVPGIVAEIFDELAARTGRRYGLVDYHGAVDAERVVVVMGSAAGALEETVDDMVAAGARVGMVRGAAVPAVPEFGAGRRLAAGGASIAVLDRTKEPGAVGEPLYLSVRGRAGRVDGRLQSRFGADATGDRWPIRAVVEGVDTVDAEAGVRRARGEQPEAAFHGRDLRRCHPPQFADGRRLHSSAPAGEVQAMFFGLGSDGTVGANKAR